MLEKLFGKPKEQKLKENEVRIVLPKERYTLHRMETRRVAMYWHA